jgi:hypothetical protein
LIFSIPVIKECEENSSSYLAEAEEAHRVVGSHGAATAEG